jgi:hypothetical protein
MQAVTHEDYDDHVAPFEERSNIPIVERRLWALLYYASIAMFTIGLFLVLDR